MRINWQMTCCAEHGEYAEARTKAGGVMRLRRVPGSDAVQVCRFGADNRAVDVVDGVPAYVDMTLTEAEQLVE